MNTMTALTLVDLPTERDKPLRLTREESLSRRIAWSTEGWFITLRTPDAAMSSGLARKHADIRVIGNEVVAGPFKTREGLMSWFTRFIDVHGQPRNPETREDYVPFVFVA